MRSFPAHYAREVFERRREALAHLLGDTCALFPAGAAPSRNYRATHYPFRATSHFLHLVGLSCEHATLVYSGGTFTLFAEPPSLDDAIWHGPRLTLAEIANETGLVVHPLEALGALRAETACLPVRDLETRDRVEKLLGRVPSEPPSDPRDVRLAEAMIAARLLHDTFAVSEIERTLLVTRRAFEAGVRATARARSMREVRAAILGVFEQMGVQPAYGPIVTTRGEVLHSEDSSEALDPHALVLADVGAESHYGYATDVTRTWPVTSASTTQAALLSLVRAAQAAAITKVTPGARYRDVHVEAARVIADGLVSLGIFSGDPIERVMDGTIALLFPHGIGHLLGLDVHDMEDLGDLAGYGDGFARDPSPTFRYLRLDRLLVKGMAVTIEPGVYFIPGLIDDPDTRRAFAGRVDFSALDKFRDARGIRIEDDVLVTESGARVLSGAIPVASGEA